MELGIFYTLPTESSWKVTRLGLVEFQIVLSPKRAGKRFSLKDLDQTHYIGSRGEDYSQHYKFPTFHMLKSLGVKIRTGLQSNSQETMKRAVLDGCGYTTLPRHMIEKELKSGKLIVVSTPRRITAPLYLVTLKGRTLTQAGRLFSEIIKETL